MPLRRAAIGQLRTRAAFVFLIVACAAWLLACDRFPTVEGSNNQNSSYGGGAGGAASGGSGGGEAGTVGLAESGANDAAVGDSSTADASL
ncbi:MAG: hypothetical protein HRU17_16240 [Polyangiaceae bacterium]|nr:hypothetical protein [Polyangiaceae bacterium]